MVRFRSAVHVRWQSAFPSASSTSVPTKKSVNDEDVWIVNRESGAFSHDIPVWTARSGLVDIRAESGQAKIVRENVPHAPGVFMLSNVLSPDECDRIIAVSERMGYLPDAPVSLGRDVRKNDNCVWIADQRSLNGKIFQRVRHYLPAYLPLENLRDSDEATGYYGDRGGFPNTSGTTESVSGNLEMIKKSKIHIGPVAGLNQRWRLYRYSPTDVFRPHTDGAWPGTGLDREDGKSLVHDLYDGNQLSMLTFLIYLNDDCEGGETKFYFPTNRVEKVGELDAKNKVSSWSGSGSSDNPSGSEKSDLTIVSVKPKRGAVLCFWHGTHPLSPLHEGGLVHPCSASSKYIIRTDVLYDISASEDYQRYFQQIASIAGQAQPLMPRNVTVGNLSAPGPEINDGPCLCVFLLSSALTPDAKKLLAKGLSEFCVSQDPFKPEQEGGLGAMPCYAAVAPSGAVGQVREICGGELDREISADQGAFLMIMDMSRNRFAIRRVTSDVVQEDAPDNRVINFLRKFVSDYIAKGVTEYAFAQME